MNEFNLSGSLKGDETAWATSCPPYNPTVIASRQTVVSGFTAYECVVARVRSTRGNPIAKAYAIS
ncbi:MAG: hypothetical protein IKZ88_10445 [Neisseriaceae bacterium]|nr:hypothetical protein [Neisseriaceae bacterium]